MGIGQNIKRIMDEKGVTVLDVVEKMKNLGVTMKRTGEHPKEQTIYSYLNESRPIEARLLPYFSKILGVPEQEFFDDAREWKLYILKEAINEKSPEALDLLKSQYPAISETIEVPILSHEVSAGHGLEPYETEVIDRVVVDKDKFFPGVPPHKIDGVIVKGDSMEPTLYEGDYVFLYRFDWDEEIEKIDDIYVINVDNQLKVKRLNFMLNGHIRVISDNPKYKPEEVNPNETQVYFRIIGRVLKKFGKV